MKTIPIKGIIGLDVTLESFTQSLQAAAITAEDEVTFDLSSPGGSVVTGFEIFNEIKNLQAKKKIAQVNGMSASIASIIMMAADQIDVSEMSLLMIHKASGDGQGNADDLAQQIEVLNLIDELLINTYYDRNQAKGSTKLTRDKVQDMLGAETWMKPSEALAYGFIDNVINKTDASALAKLAAVFNPNKSMKHLEKLKALLAGGGRVELTADHIKTAVTTALDGRKYSEINDENGAAFLGSVKGLLEKIVGGTLTEAEQAIADGLLNAFITELKAQEESQSSQGQLNEIRKQIADLANLVKTMSETVVASGQQLEAVAFDLTETKKNIRTFGKKPFSNDMGKLSLGDGYQPQDPGHIARMEAIRNKIKETKK